MHSQAKTSLRICRCSVCSACKLFNPSRIPDSMIGRGSEENDLADGSAVVIPAGTEHNIINSSQVDALKLYTIYSPPEHPQGTIHKNKAEAVAYEKEHHH